MVVTGSLPKINMDMFSSQNIDRLFDQRVNDLRGQTVSLCHHCYRHVPAIRYRKNDSVWLTKSCETHGVSHHLLERDADFYDNLVYSENNPLVQNNSVVMIDVTDRCNVQCPHCYHVPNNKKSDKSIEYITDRIKCYPTNFDKILLVGAEPTMRNDLDQLIPSIKDIDKKISVGMLSNGIRFSNLEFAKMAKQSNLSSICFGLNHPSYLNNESIRKKQLQGILNTESVGIQSVYVGYTMCSLSELDFIMNEIHTMDWKPWYFRIRYGSDIGRYPDQERLYVSDIVKHIKEWCEKNKKSFEIIEGDNNIYHTMVNAGGKIIRAIQWCNPEDIDMEELITGPWSDFSGEPISNFLHQIIRRDITVNHKIALPDQTPERYLLRSFPSTEPLKFEDIVT